jgi:hypothetical protein
VSGLKPIQGFFFKNIGRMVQECWDDAGRENIGGRWKREVSR